MRRRRGRKRMRRRRRKKIVGEVDPTRHKVNAWAVLLFKSD